MQTFLADRVPQSPGDGRCARPRILIDTAILALAASTLLCGCSHLTKSTASDKVEVKALSAKNQKVGSTTIGALQSEVMRFADDFASTVAQAADDFSAGDTNAEIRVAGLKWKLELASAAYINAANRNPVLNALDMIVLATLSRMVIESESEKLGDHAAALVETHRRLETNSWGLVDGVLRDEQKAELRGILTEWRKKNPNQRYVGGTRFREFAVGLGKTPETGKTKPTSIFNLLFIDPMAGLDPTARAIEETRQSAERMSYYAQRAPVLLSWQVQLLSYQLAEQPAARQMLADAGRLSKSTEIFAQTADKLPSLVDQQREAALKQFFEGIALERTNLIASLATEEEKVRGLLTETRETLKAGGQMASSVDGAIQSLHSFVRYVSPDSNSPPAALSTNSKPFDILDYGKTASQVGAMALDLDKLLTSVNQSLPQVTALGQQAQVNAKSVVDRAFWLGLLLILILLAASVVAGLVYRILAMKLTKQLDAETKSAQNQLQI
jgi:hypothetical protein